MTLKTFEKIIEKLQKERYSQEIYLEWLKENREMISYNDWEKRVILEAVKQIEF